ncbi:hypothetical protein [Candidatus Nitrosotalea okcheonensis]|uniref:Uncharacterized protein n=1 Tax=Candidatus Nitrosotalea okcheonensis TaxID=1903276 RepID=A0A2H1FEC3_9ARCH|nr:hypothetical protein [Candidatus Nitrosotalea okcheonensis]SMH71114.1 protein of unknown function [Candidatus Nitrosotalea okcheonensis]
MSIKAHGDNPAGFHPTYLLYLIPIRYFDMKGVGKFARIKLNKFNDCN